MARIKNGKKVSDVKLVNLFVKEAVFPTLSFLHFRPLALKSAFFNGFHFDMRFSLIYLMTLLLLVLFLSPTQLLERLIRKL